MIDKEFKLKTRKYPPQIQDMKNFENDLLTLIENIQFKNVPNKFLNKSNEVLTKFDTQINCLYPLIKPKIVTK